MNRIKQAAKSFIKLFEGTKITADAIKGMLVQQGYLLVEYSQFSNSDDVEKILLDLGLKELSLTTKAFTYVDNSCRIVFILEGLSDFEALVLLAHEEGHIMLEHATSDHLFGKDIVNEYEANEFSHYVLHCSGSVSVRHFIHKHRAKLIFLGIIFLTVICAAIMPNGLSVERVPASAPNSNTPPETYPISTPADNTTNDTSQMDNAIPNDPSLEQQGLQEGVPVEEGYYVTPTGEKYHLATCPHVKYKDNIQFLTMTELEEQGYSPCNVCKPDGF